MDLYTFTPWCNNLLMRVISNKGASYQIRLRPFYLPYILTIQLNHFYHHLLLLKHHSVLLVQRNFVALRLVTGFKEFIHMHSCLEFLPHTIPQTLIRPHPRRLTRMLASRCFQALRLHHRLLLQECSKKGSS